jgi:hypothetical protein
MVSAMLFFNTILHNKIVTMISKRKIGVILLTTLLSSLFFIHPPKNSKANPIVLQNYKAPTINGVRLSLPQLMQAKFTFSYEAGIQNLTAKIFVVTENGLSELTSRVMPNQNDFLLPQNQSNNPIQLEIKGYRPFFNRPIEMRYKVLSQTETETVIGFEDGMDTDYNDIKITCTISF